MRAGDNLYSSSVLALDAKTGRYRWHYQEIHHDLWDYGAPNPVVLFDATVSGQPRKGLAQLNKDGYAYILDRVTGKPLIGIEERPVMQNAAQKTAATQPIPIGDDIVSAPHRHRARRLRAGQPGPHVHALRRQARSLQAAAPE